MTAANRSHTLYHFAVAHHLGSAEVVGLAERILPIADGEERDGATTVRFTHSGLADEEAVRSHEDGWAKAFANLKRTLEPARPAA